jgi:hypothetical protein
MDRSMLEEVWARLLKTDFDFNCIEAICPKSLNFEIQRTYYALKFWELTPGLKRYKKEEILRCTLFQGPIYAEILSDEWDYGIRRMFRIPGISSEYMEWKPITHYNELPPVNYLIRWKESTNDIEYMKTPLWDFDENLIDEFRNEFFDSLPDYLELPDDVEILSEVKTSTSLDLDKMKSIPFYQARLTREGSEFSNIFKGKRSVIPVGPANTRDAVVTTIDTFNSMKWCDLVMMTLLEDQEESLVTQNPQKFQSRLKKMTQIPRSGQMYWLRDIKKCGLTFPRELFHIMQECLSEKYPDKDFSRFNIFRYYSIWDEKNKPIKTARGYCLGMANNLVTYAQCIISKMLLKRIPDHIEVEALYGNDDSCLKIWSRENYIDHIDAMMIQCEDFEILRGLNIITNDKKSFWSWWPILFEEYGHEDFQIKHSRIACALSNSMIAPDIKYAKFLSSAISMALWDNGDWIKAPLAELVNKWGYEYYPQECNYDYTLGGWISIRSKGMNPMLRMIERCPDELLQPMWVAANEINRFQKEVIKPVLSGTVTKNYSVTGSIHNITYVDIEIYDIPELPIEMIYLDKKGYKDFYESIYRFNRNPYTEMARRLRRVTSSHPGIIIDRLAFMEYSLKNFKKLAIPETFVISSTSIFEIRENDNLDCWSLRRNCIGRFLMSLKGQDLLMMPDLDLPPSGEYPYLANYDDTPYTERIKGITTLNGEIPDGIYQFSTNPWLPIYEYVMEYDRFPSNLFRLVEDRNHLPIWFMTRQYRNSSEVSLAYNFRDEGELYVNYIIDMYRECSSKEIEKKEDKKLSSFSICQMCDTGLNIGWDRTCDIYNLLSDGCTLCILGDHLWRSRKRSTNADSIRERRECLSDIPIFRSRITYFIKKYCPLLEESLSLYLQEDTPAQDFFAADDSDHEDALFDMFG